MGEDHRQRWASEVRDLEKKQIVDQESEWKHLLWKHDNLVNKLETRVDPLGVRDASKD
jgi:hypothetical protein